MDYIRAEDVIEILGRDVLAADFYEVFFEELEERGYDWVETELFTQDVIKLVCALALQRTVDEFYGGKRQSLCNDRGISKDKAYRLTTFLQQNRVFVERIPGVYKGESAIIRVADEPEIRISVTSVSAETTDERVNWHEEGSEAEAVTESARIKTLDQLVAACNIDLETWEIYDHIVNKWEVGAKNELGEIVVEPLFQVKARLRKRVLDKPRFPHVQPITIGLSLVAIPEVKRGGFKRALIVPDPQIGFKRNIRTGELMPVHDRRAMDVVLQVAQTEHFDRITFLGDWLDLAEWSDKYVQSPEFYQTTQPAIVEGRWWLEQFRRAQPAAEMDFLLGNHEHRIEKKLYLHFSAAFGVTAGGVTDAPPIISVDNMLDLRSLGIRCSQPYPDGEVWFNDCARAIHGEVARKGAGATVKAMLNQYDETTIQGHVHRVELSSRLVHGRKGKHPIYMFSAGCLCRIDGAVPAATSRVDWQQGFGVLEYDENGTDHHITPGRIHEGRSLYAMQIIEGRSHEEALSQDTGWNFRTSLRYAA